jgi:hypothetical protein
MVVTRRNRRWGLGIASIALSVTASVLGDLAVEEVADRVVVL